MSHHDHQAASPQSENLVAMLLAFFPGKGEITAFAGGIVVGVGMLAVLALLGFAIGGHKGLWPTF